MKNFRSQFTQTTKGLVLLLAFMAGGVLVASAADWTPPTANPPANNAPAPINVSNDNQLKGTAGGAALSFLPYAANTPAFMASLPATSTSRAIFSWSGLGVVGNSDFYGNVTAGSAGTIPSYNSGTGHYQYELNSWLPAIFHGRPLTVDLKTGLSTNTGANGRNVLNFVGTDDNDSVGIIQNKPNFFLWEYSTPGGDRASLQAKNGNFSGSISADDNGTIGNNLSIANNIRIGGGGPKPTSVLTSIDDQGNAQWSSVSSLLDIKYVSRKFAGYSAGSFADMQCPQGYVAISANCDCENGLDACQIAQFDSNNNATAIPENASSDTLLSVNWGSSDPHPDWVTGNCRNNGDLHMQAVCLRLADQGNNPEFSWKNIQAKNRLHCDQGGAYWTGSYTNFGAASLHGCSVAGLHPGESPVVFIGGAGQSAKDWYLDKSNDGNQYAYALMNASPDAPSSTKWGPSGASFYSGWQAQYTGGLISASQLGNFNTGVRHSNYRDQGTNAANGEVAGCLYTTKAPGEGRPPANKLNWNVDAMSQIAGNLYSGPCDDNPQNDNGGPGGQYPGTLYPVLTNDILFLKGQ